VVGPLVQEAMPRALLLEQAVSPQKLVLVGLRLNIEEVRRESLLFRMVTLVFSGEEAGGRAEMVMEVTLSGGAEAEAGDSADPQVPLFMEAMVELEATLALLERRPEVVEAEERATPPQVVTAPTGVWKSTSTTKEQKHGQLCNRQRL